MAAELIQIYYTNEQKEKLFDFAKPYFNSGLTIFFENDPIKKLVLATEADKIAVCSWKLRDKLRWYIGRPRALTPELLDSDYDVLSFTRNTKYHKMLAAAEVWHPGFLKIFDKMLGAIGVSRPGEIKTPIYQNHFSARTQIYKDYIQSYLSPVMDAMVSDKELNEMVMRDSHYSDLTHQTAEHLQEKIGINYYPLVPFLLERLFSVYVHNKKLNVTPL